MELRTKYVIGIAAPILLFLIMPNAAHAQYRNGWNGLGGAYSSGYYAGQQDAIYDHDNNLAYNPVGQCLPCHSELYWSNFHAGYDHQWNSYQAQESTRGTSINVYGNNNYVNTAQYSGQNQQGLGTNLDFNPPGCCPNCLGSNCDNDGSPDP